jgi:hypothetical protein
MGREHRHTKVHIQKFLAGAGFDLAIYQCKGWVKEGNFSLGARQQPLKVLVFGTKTVKVICQSCMATRALPLGHKCTATRSSGAHQKPHLEPHLVSGQRGQACANTSLRVSCSASLNSTIHQCKGGSRKVALALGLEGWVAATQSFGLWSQNCQSHLPAMCVC